MKNIWDIQNDQLFYDEYNEQFVTIYDDSYGFFIIGIEIKDCVILFKHRELIDIIDFING